MNGVYEQFEGLKKSKRYLFVKITLWISNIIAAVYLFLFQSLFSMLAALVSLLLMLHKREAFVEYEYKFNSGDITIIKIFDKKRRKKVMKFNINQIEAMFPETEANLASYSNYTVTGKDFYNDKEKQVYGVLLNRENEKYFIRFTPNSEFVDYCFKSNPRKVKRN